MKLRDPRLVRFLGPGKNHTMRGLCVLVGLVKSQLEQTPYMKYRLTKKLFSWRALSFWSTCVSSGDRAVVRT